MACTPPSLSFSGVSFMKFKVIECFPAMPLSVLSIKRAQPFSRRFVGGAHIQCVLHHIGIKLIRLIKMKK